MFLFTIFTFQLLPVRLHFPLFLGSLANPPPIGYLLPTPSSRIPQFIVGFPLLNQSLNPQFPLLHPSLSPPSPINIRNPHPIPLTFLTLSHNFIFLLLNLFHILSISSLHLLFLDPLHLSPLLSLNPPFVIFLNLMYSNSSLFLRLPVIPRSLSLCLVSESKQFRSMPRALDLRFPWQITFLSQLISYFPYGSYVFFNSFINSF